MRILKVILTITIVLFANQLLFSAPPPPPGGAPTCWPPPCIPIDGGVTLLIAAGAAYGAKRLHNSRKKGSKQA